MPSPKYYRTVLDRDCLQLIGDYAGDKDYKLVFTLTKKRGFLSNILLVWRDPTLYCNYKPICILKEKHWVPVRLDCIAEIITVLNERCTLPAKILEPSLHKITDILLEIHDFVLRRRARKMW